MDPQLFILLLVLVVIAALCAGAILGAWLYRAGSMRSSPVPRFPRLTAGAGPEAPREQEKPYHRKPPKP